MNRSIFTAMALASFCSMAAMRLCDAMLPALGATFGVAATSAAGAISAFAIAYGLGQLGYGPIGDRVGKLHVVAFAAMACGLGALAAAAASSLGWLVTARAAMGLAAGGIIPMTIAWVGDQVPLAERQVTMARLLGFTVVGIIGGSWLGGAAADLVGWRMAFVAIGTLLLVCGVSVRRMAVREVAHVSTDTTPYLARVRGIVASPAARGVYITVFCEGACVFGVLAFVPTMLHERFGLSLYWSGASMAAFGLGGFAYSRLASRLVRWLPGPRLAFAGGLALAFAFFVLAFAPHWGWAAPACLFAGLGFYMLHGTLQVCATQLSETARGTAVSLFVCLLFVGQSVGIAAASWVLRAHPAALWFAFAGAGLVGVSCFFAMRVHASLAAHAA